MSLPSRGDVVRTYDAIAESFDQSRERPWPEVADFAKSLPPSIAALDLGCGNGRHTKLLCDAGRRVTGLDASKKLIAIARRREPRATYVQGDVCHLPLREKTFSAAMLTATIHHLASESERLSAVHELHRVLRRGGRALMSAWSFEQALKDPRMRPVRGGGSTDVWVPWRGGGAAVDRFYHLFREGELRDLVLSGGFRVERYFRSGDNDFVVAVRDG